MTRICLLICLLAGGCNIIAPIVAKTVPETEKPKYVGLQGQTVGVMVWADRAIRMDWERIQLDVANAIQSAMQTSGAGELRGAVYSVQPASIVRFQYDHPELETAPITDYAAQFGVSRLIYVELEKFSTRSDLTYQMFRGSAVATLRVIEINGNTAKIVYEENGITAGFPKKGPSEGEVVGTDSAFYGGTVRVLAEEIVKRLTTHETRPLM
jgi:hypothetical protein